MTKVRTWVGLDVHAVKVVACVVDAESGEMIVRGLSGLTSEVVAFCAALPAPVRTAYEAGPTGFGLARALLAAGVGCVIAAPGKIERPVQDRVKTDRRDAERLVRLLMIDGLHAVRVPSDEEEALRDLVRAREDLRGDLMRARHRLGKLLLRHAVRYDGEGDNWTQRHRDWLSNVELSERGAQATLLDYLGAIDTLIIRRDTIQRTIGELVPASPWADDVARLRCLRGIDTLTAVGLCAEIGDFARFEHPSQLMSYVRARALRENQRRDPPPGSDHQDRLPARQTAADRGGLALPPPTTPGHHARAPPTRPARKGDRDRLEDPAAPAPALATPGHTRSCGTQPANTSLTARRAPTRTAAPSAEHNYPANKDPAAQG